MEKPDFNNPYFDRLVGISSESERQEEELAAINTIEELGGKKIEEFEIEKTPRDIELLKFAEDSVRAVLQKYGRKKEIQVPLNNIHVLVAGGTKKSFDGSIDGAHFSLSGSVVVDRFLSDIKFTTTAFHELMHLLSYKALQLSVGEKKEDEEIIPYRVGIKVYSRDGEKRYFEVFDEAIVGLLEKGFYEDVIRKSDLFREELEKNPDFKLVLNRQPELDDLNMLVDELWSRNNEQFSDREQIVDMFVEAHVNGHLLKIGRLIESTFGKGSFRDFADDADSYEDKGGVESKAE